MRKIVPGEGVIALNHLGQLGLINRKRRVNVVVSAGKPCNDEICKSARMTSKDNECWDSCAGGGAGADACECECHDGVKILAWPGIHLEDGEIAICGRRHAWFVGRDNWYAEEPKVICTTNQLKRGGRRGKARVIQKA